MRQQIAAVVICLCAITVVQAQSAALPAACGANKVKFTITAEKHGQAVPTPEAGKALLVFIEVDNQDRTCVSCNSKIRYGADGEWLGASQGNSYFTTSIAPGVHHLCANWQSAPTVGQNKKVGLLSLSADPGRVYYFQAKIEYVDGPDFQFSPLNEDQGALLAKASRPSNASVKK